MPQDRDFELCEVLKVKNSSIWKSFLNYPLDKLDYSKVSIIL